MITDVGGVAAAGGAHIRTDTVFRLSGGLAGPDELARLRAAGLRCVIDLRGEDEDRAAIREWAAAMGLEYITEPIPAANRGGLLELVASGATSEDAGAEMDRLYRLIVARHGREIAGTIGALAEYLPAGYGCAAGKDRTGIVTALLHSVLGVRDDDVVHHYVVSAPSPARLMVLAHDYLGLVEGEELPPAAEVFFSTRPDAIREMLAFLRDSHGGVAQYLADHGLGADAVDHLRAQLVVKAAA